MQGLWRGENPLLLASKSLARRALLTAAGIPFETVDAQIDERAVEASLHARGAEAAEIAAHLARAKALSVSKAVEARLVLGADQVLSLDDAIFSKPRDLSEAKAQLTRLSGRSHYLLSAVCVARAGNVHFETVVRATLSCRVLSDAFIDHYIAAVGPAALASVGAYHIEGLGIHLFERIEGDYATIMGLPLLPLLEFLRQEGSLAG